MSDTESRNRRPPGASHGALSLIVANPAAGAGRARARMARLGPLLESWPRPPEIVWSTSALHARELARAAAAAGRTLVIAAGGDGTVHEVVNGLLAAASASPPVLGYLPIGTSGDFGRSLGLPRDPRTVARELPSWDDRPIDIGRVDFAAGPAPEYFVNCANVGIAVRVARRVDGSRALQRLGRSCYPLAAVIEARRAPLVRVRLHVEGTAGPPTELLHLSIANGAYFGGGLRPIAEASLSSGRLHLLWLGDLGAVGAARELLRALRHLPPGHPSTGGATVTGVRVEGDAAVELDGQLPGRLPATFTALPHALEARAPGPPVGPRPESASPEDAGVGPS